MSELVFNSPTLMCCGQSRADCTCRPVGNGSPDRESASASLASLDAMDALDYSADGDHEAAAKAHRRAASKHERRATMARQNGWGRAATMHDQASALHRKAASVHAAAVDDDDETDDDEGDEQTMTNSINHGDALPLPLTLNQLLANEKAQGSNADLSDQLDGSGTGANYGGWWNPPTMKDADEDEEGDDATDAARLGFGQRSSAADTQYMSDENARRLGLASTSGVSLPLRNVNYGDALPACNAMDQIIHNTRREQAVRRERDRSRRARLAANRQATPSYVVSQGDDVLPRQGLFG